MTPDLALLETVILLPGGHASPGEGVCAMEAIALAMGLPHSDVPACTDAPLARAFQRVNDWYGWRSDEARTAFLRPHLMRLGRLALGGKRAPLRAYGFAAADLAVRVFAPHALEARFPDHAAKLRGLLPVVDARTAAAAYDAAYAADAACAAAYAAAAAAADAADAAYAACAAAYAAAADAACAAAAAAAAAAARAARAATYAAAADARAARAATYAAAARAATYAAAAARTARATTYAAADAADAAACAAARTARATTYAAAAAAAYEDLAGQLLTRLLDVGEAGRWPLGAP